MKLSRLFLLFLIAFSGCFAGCAPVVNVTLTNKPSTASDSKTVLVLEKGQPRPADTETIGLAKISDSGFSFNCSYSDVVELAKQETLKAGGNALQIIKHQTPDIWSTCHRIEVDMLYIPGKIITQSEPPVKPSSIRHPELEKVKAQQKAHYESLKKAESDTSKFVFIEQQPEFPGGPNAMIQFLSSSLKYPKTAMRDKISGRVIGSFVVDKNGEITDPKILKGVREDIDQEFIRLIMSMPAWIPGFQNGKAVKVRYNIPMNFWCEKPKKNKVKEN